MATVIEKIRALPCVKNHDKSCELVPLLDQLEWEISMYQGILLEQKRISSGSMCKIPMA